MPQDENGTDGAGNTSLHKLEPQTIISPRSTTALILRLQALVSEWLKAEVDEDSITGADGIVTEGVVNTFLQAGGDLSDAVPFALLESRKSFIR
jgi:hypothetical protein